MKKKHLILALSGLAILVVLALLILDFYQGKVAEDDNSRASYYIGRQIGDNFHKQNIDLDAAVLKRGLEDGLKGKTPALSPEEMEKARQTFQRIASERLQQIVTTNKQNADKFLAENKKQEGWVTLPSGLQYKVLKAGKGKKPGPHSTVRLHFLASLADGTKIDSTLDRGIPGDFQMDRVLRGWKEALPLMAEGSRWTLLIPPELGYGPGGAGPVPPNSVLIYDIELIKVLKDK